jgi:hypothetical protein
MQMIKKGQRDGVKDRVPSLSQAVLLARLFDRQPAPGIAGPHATIAIEPLEDRTHVALGRNTPWWGSMRRRPCKSSDSRWQWP